MSFLCQPPRRWPGDPSSSVFLYFQDKQEPQAGCGAEGVAMACHTIEWRPLELCMELALAGIKILGS